ncbi:UnbV_ASPIC domain-containing protein [Candidatus Nitrotoga sp. BS]|uniref:CRTAC1 family protein n=1 Tax=Candidatus Nitrotoga sp. BS TaxID=2890408 RepID=UPI001EF26F64|nr:CRTAC1 family protein [Candidatus Nitrotoga sp. BS]CAH1202356.1 UnbV_ASPIC domain-containing protein [Candidatus Nitrotoga sp. BS]
MTLPTRLFTICLAAVLAGCSPAEKDLTVFEDITAKSGLGAYVGMTHGAAWGDYDGNGQPDLYLPNHLKQAMLFRNLGGGRFADVTASVLSPNDLGGDKHGAAWADFNNDGQLDLVQLTGAIQGVGVEPKRLFVNDSGKLVERAAQLGVDNPPGRTRMPLWLDINQDGKLDLFQGAEARFDDLTPPFMYVQQDGHFDDATPRLKPDSRSAPFCVLAELNNDRYPEVVCRLMGKGRPVQVFDTRTSPALSLDLLPNSAFDDIIAGDFDNDGAIDLFLARKNPGGRVALAHSGKNVLTAQIELSPRTLDQPTSFRFKNTGALDITLFSQNPVDLTPADIRLGEKATQPVGLTFALVANGAHGLPQPRDGARLDVLIGSPKPGHWQVDFHARPELFGGKAQSRYFTIRVQSKESINDVEALGDAAKDETAPARLFMNRGGKLVEESNKRGVNAVPITAVNAVAGDFDNDMYLDIFVLGSSDAGKTANMLLLNNGKGEFEIVRHAGGASGWLVGVGDSVTTADIDGDGFLDLLTASGGSMGRSLGLPSDNGRYQLFRNVGNGNHWIEIDLEGTTSNRDGIGAVVRILAGGVTQMRLQDGGTHNRSQNHQRLHFGLAKHTQIEKITVHWPSGHIQELSGTKADQVLRIKEPTKSAALPE